MMRSKSIALLAGAAVVAAAAFWIFSSDDRPAPVAAAVAAEDSAPTLEVISAVGEAVGFTYAVAVLDSIAVFNRGSDLVAVDVSDPSVPVTLGSLTLPGPIRDVVLGGGFAFVAADSAGLQIVDLSSPARPVVSGSMLFGDRVQGVAVDGSTVYVAARSEGLRVLDVSNPADPMEIGHFITPDEAVDVVVRDGYAYIAAWYESMRVIDVSDPTHPEEVSYASFDSYDNGAAWTVFVEGDIGLNTIPEMGLRTVDISDPRNVKLYKVYRGLFAPAGVTARGKTAFVADQSAGFRVLDLADPVMPVEIGAVQLSGTPLHVVLGGDYAYVAAREGGLRIVDISNPNDPFEAAPVDVDDEIVDVAFDGDALFAAGSENGIYSVQDGLQPYSTGAARRVLAADGRLIVAGEGGVHFYDRTDAPAAFGTSLPGAAFGVAVRAGLTVAAAGTDGLHLFDGARHVGAFVPERSRIDSLSREQFLRTPLASWDVILDGDTAFGAFDDGIRIVDVSSPGQPRLTHAIPTPQRVYRLARAGDILLAACDDGLRAYRMGSWEEIAYVKTPSFATALAVQDDRVYVGDLAGSITIVDLARLGSDPHGADRPEVIGTYEVADRVHGLAVSGDELAVAAGRQGVRVIRLPLGEN